MKRCLLLPLVAASAAIAVSGCAGVKPGSGVSTYKAYDRPAKLPEDPSQVVVKVSTARQRVYVMEGSKPLLVMPVSVGTASTPTPLGDFTIFRKDRNKRSKAHGFAYSGTKTDKTLIGEKPAGWSFKGTPLPYWCEFKKEYAFHTGWIKHTPCTNGCIRMHENLAPKFFRLVQEGTPVNIAKTQPEDLKYANIPLPPDAGPLPDYPDSYYISDDSFSDHMTPEFR